MNGAQSDCGPTVGLAIIPSGVSLLPCAEPLPSLYRSAIWLAEVGIPNSEFTHASLRMYYAILDPRPRPAPIIYRGANWPDVTERSRGESRAIRGSIFDRLFFNTTERFQFAL